MGRLKGSRTGCNDVYGGVCSVLGCDQKLRAKGFCPTHLLRFNKHGTTELVLAITHKGTCTDCGVDVTSRGSRPRLRCADCLSKQNVARVERWLASPRGRRLVSQSRKQAKANRTARKFHAPGRHTTAEFRALCERWGWKCVYCKCDLTDATATRDHIVPLSRGGSNAIENIAPACDSCNKKKHARTPEEWAASLEPSLS